MSTNKLQTNIESPITPCTANIQSQQNHSMSDTQKTTVVDDDSEYPDYFESVQPIPTLGKICQGYFCRMKFYELMNLCIFVAVSI